jgi:hypothetical protein
MYGLKPVPSMLKPAFSILKPAFSMLEFAFSKAARFVLKMIDCPIGSNPGLKSEVWGIHFVMEGGAIWREVRQQDFYGEDGGENCFLWSASAFAALGGGELLETFVA